MKDQGDKVRMMVRGDMVKEKGAYGSMCSDAVPHRSALRARMRARNPWPAHFDRHRLDRPLFVITTFIIFIIIASLWTTAKVPHGNACGAWLSTRWGSSSWSKYC